MRMIVSTHWQGWQVSSCPCAPHIVWMRMSVCTRIDRGDGGSIVLCHWPSPFLRTNVPHGPVVQMAQVKGSHLTSLQGVPHTLPPPPTSWFHLFLHAPIKLAVCPVDGQNMLMSFPQRIFAQSGNSYLDTQQLDIMGSWNKLVISKYKTTPVKIPAQEHKAQKSVHSVHFVPHLSPLVIPFFSMDKIFLKTGPRALSVLIIWTHFNVLPRQTFESCIVAVKKHIWQISND